MNQSKRARRTAADLFNDSVDLIVTGADACERSRRLLAESARACDIARHTRRAAIADTAARMRWDQNAGAGTSG